MPSDLKTLCEDLGISYRSLICYIHSLLKNNPFIISEIKALEFCEKVFNKSFLRTNMFDTPDLISEDGEIWVEVKDFSGIAPGSSTLTLSQLRKLFEGVRKGRHVYIAIVFENNVHLVSINKFAREIVLESKEYYIKLLALINREIEEVILAKMRENV